MLHACDPCASAHIIRRVLKTENVVAKSRIQFSILAMIVLCSLATSSSYGEASAAANSRFQKALKSVGLNGEQLDKVYYNYVGTLTAEKVRENANWLKQQGVKDVPKFIASNPGILGLSIEDNLQLKVNWLKDQNVKDVGAFLSLSPQFLSLSLEQNIKVKAQWLEQKGVKDVGKLISLFPGIFHYSIDKSLKPKLELLRKSGVEDPFRAISMAPSILGQSQASVRTKIKYLRNYGVKDVGALISTYPSILSYSGLKYDAKMMWLKNQGVKDTAQVLVNFPSFFGQSIKSLDSKVRWFKKQGIQDIGRLIETYPNILGSSIEDSLEPKLKWLEGQGIQDIPELIARYPQIFSLSIEDNLDPKMIEYRDIWKLSTEELEKTPIYFGSSLKRVQELRDFLNEIAKMGGAKKFAFSRLSENQRRKLIQNLSAEKLMDYLKQIHAIDESRESLADLTKKERTLLGELYKSKDLSKLFIWEKEFNREFKYNELTCLLKTIRKGLKIN